MFQNLKRVGLSVAALACFASLSHAQDVYIALGDSYALGYTNQITPPNNGLVDAGNNPVGYAGRVAQQLDAQNGATDLLAFNFAISGETTNSALLGTQDALGGGVLDAAFRAPSFNTNYDGLPAGTSQADLALAKITELAGMGLNVDLITIQLGGNDILGLFAQPAFLFLPPADQQTLLTARFTALANNYVGILSVISAQLPGTKVVTVGYADTFRGLGAANPLLDPAGSGLFTADSPFSTFLTNQANSIISQVTAAFGYQYVNIYDNFLDNELTLSQIGTTDPPGQVFNGFNANFHPSEAGYQAIAAEVFAAANSPEPGTIALLLTAGIPVVGLVRRRK